MNKLLFVIAFFIVYVAKSPAQMPPPGYERAIKQQEERNKLSQLDRDSIAIVDTVAIFDPNTYEQEVKIMSFRVSVRDYCIRYLGMANPDILLDGHPHVIIDPETYEDITVRLTPDGKIERNPK